MAKFNSNPLIISCCLSGAGTTRELAPAVPLHPDEIAADVVKVVKAGAAIVHIHVRDDQGKKSMSLDKFTQAVELTRQACKKENLDVVINLTTSGGSYVDVERVQHLEKLRPEMCSYDCGTLNWSNSFVFENHPRFLELLTKTVLACDIKPEVEVFDTGFMGNTAYYIKKHGLKVPTHYQFIMNVDGGIDGSVKSLAFLVDMLPEGSTWSVSGIGSAHMPMLLAALAMGADGVRVGLEDVVVFSRDKNGNKIVGTNEQFVQRAVEMAKLAGREIATAQQARDLLGIKRKCL
jgi:3-keto-5-aminohexanoate cleavage enzyme